MKRSGRKVTTRKITTSRMKKRKDMFGSSQRIRLRDFSKKSVMTSIHYSEKLAPFLDSLYWPHMPTLAMLYYSLVCSITVSLSSVSSNEFTDFTCIISNIVITLFVDMRSELRRSGRKKSYCRIGVMLRSQNSEYAATIHIKMSAR